MKVLLKCLPLLQSAEGSFQFFHKSIIDYLLARLWLTDFADENVVNGNNDRSNNYESTSNSNKKKGTVKKLTDLNINFNYISK